jgi:hypothetical protein
MEDLQLIAQSITADINDALARDKLEEARALVVELAKEFGVVPQSVNT